MKYIKNKNLIIKKQIFVIQKIMKKTISKKKQQKKNRKKQKILKFKRNLIKICYYP